MKPSGTPLSFPDAKILVYAAPKAACTSIKRTLAASYAGIQETDKESLKKIRASLHDLKRNERHPDFLRIGFCRDPIEKIRSIYSEKIIQRKSLRLGLCELGFYKRMPLDEFIDLVVDIPEEETEKHLRSQHLLLFRDGPPDILIKFENLSKDWAVVQKAFSTRCGRKVFDLMRLNVSRVAKPHLTDRMKAMISERYKTDIEMLGY